MKKGFSLIEIIICLGIISFVFIPSIFYVQKLKFSRKITLDYEELNKMAEHSRIDLKKIGYEKLSKKTHFIEETEKFKNEYTVKILEPGILRVDIKISFNSIPNKKMIREVKVYVAK